VRDSHTHLLDVYAAVIKTMLEKGTDINSQNQDGDSPLHQAAAEGNEEGVKILLKNHAKVMIRNK